MHFDDQGAAHEPDPRAVVYRHCATCGRTFGSPDAWYEHRGLVPPHRCPACRQARRRARLEGTVAYVDGRRKFGFIAGADQRFYFAECDVADWPIGRNDLVSFVPEEPAAGRPHPRARLIQIVARAHEERLSAADSGDRK